VITFSNNQPAPYNSGHNVLANTSPTTLKKPSAIASPIVLRIIGYDRSESREAWKALSEQYRVLRIYVNFFQPSLKLLSREMHGIKVSKRYDTAKIPHQRVMLVETIGQKIKDALDEQYKILDPVALLENWSDCKASYLNIHGPITVVTELLRLQSHHVI
jgi:hypothetical protein